MMKLRHLFDNRDLAEMILKNWDYDKDKLDIMQYYRISANAVYPFRKDGELAYLRFSPTDERSVETILAELEFLEYLESQGYSANGILLSKAGEKLEQVDTPWGRYLAVAFRGAPGQRLDRIELTDEIITGYGRALGRLHELSRNYAPINHRRISWKDQLAWVRTVLHDFDGEDAAKTEAGLLEEFLSQLPVTADNYGLVHYDFETDNVFYDEGDDIFHVIDFDDCLYHWFVMDIDQSLDGLDAVLPMEKQDKAEKLFIEGYRTAFPVDDSLLEFLPVFRRYACLVGYTRTRISVTDKWDNEPDWLTDLRDILDTAMKQRSRYFGMPITVSPDSDGSQGK
ncbi:MAG: phosphotransferase [Dehalococcoidales bacterium]|nr:phosphotransferase [Dehalococcoidales bacterium]